MKTEMILVLMALTLHVNGSPPDLTNLKGPKLVKDLFSNLWNSTSTTQANVVRSLPYSPKVPATCGEFTFSLAGLDEAVHILQAELHLWLTVHSSPQQEAYIVGIQSVHADGRVSRVTMRHIEVKSADSDGYVKFEVDQLLRDAVKEGAPSILLRINIYNSFSESNNCTCGCVQDVLFPHDSFTDDTTPSLIAFTHVPLAGHTDFQTLAEKFALKSDQHSQIREVGSSQHSEIGKTGNDRRSRAANVCRIKPLVLEPSNEYFLKILERHVGNDNFVVHTPSGPFDIQTCGGICDSSIPDGSPSQNALLVDLAIKSRLFPDRDFTACCVPVKYQSFKALLGISGGVMYVEIFDFLVHTCECLDILAD